MRAAVRTLIAAFETIGSDPADGAATTLQKRLLIGHSVLISVLAVFWGFAYLVLDEPLAALIPLSYTVLSWLSIAVFAFTRRYIFFRASQLTLIVLLPFLLMVTLGGFVDSSAVILWSLLAPLGALLVSGRRAATYWFVAFAGLVVLSRILQPHVSVTNNLSDSVVLLFFVLNIVAVSFVALVLLQYFVGQRDQAMTLLGVEQEKSERLLLNVLPESVAAILKEEQRTIAEHHDATSVLFADIVGFTPLSEELEPAQMVEALNEVFTYFDDLCAVHGVEKIRTIGDNYMVASGVPQPRDDSEHREQDGIARGSRQDPDHRSNLRADQGRLRVHEQRPRDRQGQGDDGDMVSRGRPRAGHRVGAVGRDRRCARRWTPDAMIRRGAKVTVGQSNEGESF